MSGFVTAWVAVAVLAVGEGYSAYEQTAAATQQRHAQQAMLDAMNKPLPVVDPNASLLEAQAAADKRRMSILATGGQTDVTQGAGGLQPAQTTRHTLLGN